jgi:SAM-dependent methyltransferase
MKQSFQTEWHGIQFSSFYKLSSTKLPDEFFYNEFYRLFFNKYQMYEDLDSKWRDNKEQIAKWIINNFIDKKFKILSIGCGIGFVENYIFKNSNLEIHVLDYASESLNWLKKILPSQNIHQDGINSLNFKKQKFDIIYFSAVDYAFKQSDFIDNIKKYNKLLTKTGEIIIFSASYYIEPRISVKIKEKTLFYLKFILNKFGVLVNKTEQFWGWKRHRNDYIDIALKAGFNNYSEGLVNESDLFSYYIRMKK